MDDRKTTTGRELPDAKSVIIMMAKLLLITIIGAVLPCAVLFHIIGT